MLTLFKKKRHEDLFVAISVLVFSVFPFGWSGVQDSEEIGRGENTISVLKELVDRPEEGIPQALLSRAEAIAVIPGFWNAAWVIGGRHGRGVIMVRKRPKNWSYPSFIRMTGGSVGFQIKSNSIRTLFSDSTLKMMVYVWSTNRYKYALPGGIFVLTRQINKGFF